jgi:hypothetical protein
MTDMTRVLVTVNAEDADEAKEIGRRLKGFELNEECKPISLGAGKYIIIGDATEEFRQRNSR